MSVSRLKLRPKSLKGVARCPSGIAGLDQITHGGLPRGRTTLVCGSAGSGKTLLGMEFLVAGAREYDEPGVFMSFEESSEELATNVASLGLNVQALIARKKLLIDQVRVERSEIEESGAYDLQGLFIRLGHAIESIGAKRVVLDTIETLFSALTNVGILRAELRRLCRWLKERGVTAIVTGERGEGTLTRHGMEEYISDCVILLDQRVTDQIATRRLRIVKYRGSAHGTNEYPFMIDEHGFWVSPLTAIGLNYPVANDFVSTGIPKLDAAFGGHGYYRGGTLLVSGSAGSGKSSLAAHFVDAACRRGERTLVFLYEESPAQVTRNMRSIGIDLQKWVDKGLLRFQASRPSTFGLEVHLTAIQRAIDEFRPKAVVFDPISSFDSAGTSLEAKAMLMRLIDFLKSRLIAMLFTTLTPAATPAELTDVGISSLIDAWLLLRNLEQGGERTRLLYILKARGMRHSNQVREFVLTDRGVDLVDVYLGPNGILTGSARAEQDEQDSAANIVFARDVAHKRALMKHKRKGMQAHIAELKEQFEIERQEMEETIAAAAAAAREGLGRRIEAGLARQDGATAPRQSRRRSHR